MRSTEQQLRSACNVSVVIHQLQSPWEADCRSASQKIPRV
jgi:hypothetical protein